MQLRTIFDTAQFSMAELGTMLVGVSHQLPTADLVARLEAAFAQMQYSHGKFTVMVVLNHTERSKPDSAFTSGLTRLIQKYDDSFIGYATVVPNRGGIIAILVRTFLVALSLTSRQKSPHKVFEGIEVAMTWLKGLPGQPFVPGRISVSPELARFVAP